MEHLNNLGDLIYPNRSTPVQVKDGECFTQIRDLLTYSTQKHRLLELYSALSIALSSFSATLLQLRSPPNLVIRFTTMERS